jgi:hypothetical protein
MIKSFKEAKVLYHNKQLFHLRPWRQHGRVLLVAGLGFSAIGVSYIVAQPSPNREVALQYALQWVPLDMWGVWFLITGIVTIISSRWPPVSRTWGYTLLTGLSSAWSLFYLAGIILGDSPWSNVSGALVWGLFAYMFKNVSGLVDPEVVKVVLPEHLEEAKINGSS